jgi:hypothetical protein
MEIRSAAIADYNEPEGKIEQDPYGKDEGEAVCLAWLTWKEGQ